MGRRLLSCITILGFLTVNISYDHSYISHHPEKNSLRPIAGAISNLAKAGSAREFNEIAARQILGATRAGDPIASLNRIFSELTREANIRMQPELTAQALKNVFIALKTDQDRRKFTGLVGQAMTADLRELSEEYEPGFFPSALSGRATIWTITTSPTDRY